MKKILLVFLSLFLLLLPAAAAENVLLIPAFDELKTGYAGAYNEYMSKQTNAGGFNLLVRPELLAGASEDLKFRDMAKSANLGLVTDIVSVRGGLIFHKAMLSMRFVDLTTSEVLSASVRSSYGAALFNKNKGITKAVGKSAAKLTKIKPKIEAGQTFNERKTSIAIMPPAGISQDIRGRSLEAYVYGIILRDGNFNIVERRILEQQLKEQGLTLTGIVDQKEKMPAVGKIALLDYGIRYEVADIGENTIEIFNSKLYTTKITVLLENIDFKTGVKLRNDKKSYYGWSRNSKLFAFGKAMLRSMARADRLFAKNIEVYIPITSEAVQTLGLGSKEGISAAGAYDLCRIKDILDPVDGTSVGLDYKVIGTVSISDVKAHECKITLKPVTADALKASGVKYAFKKRT